MLFGQPVRNMLRYVALKCCDRLSESAKIRRYSARLSRIIVSFFNKLITKLTILSGQEKNSFIYSLACCGVQNYVYRRISVRRIMTIFGQCYK